MGSKNTQFKPGQSGNPAGRRPKSGDELRLDQEFRTLAVIVDIMALLMSYARFVDCGFGPSRGRAHLPMLPW